MQKISIEFCQKKKERKKKRKHQLDRYYMNVDINEGLNQYQKDYYALKKIKNIYINFLSSIK